MIRVVIDMRAGLIENIIADGDVEILTRDYETDCCRPGLLKEDHDEEEYYSDRKKPYKPSSGVMSNDVNKIYMLDAGQDGEEITN
jgi:hypothetical protein